MSDKELMVKEVKELSPVYVWKTGNIFHLSKRESMIAECWLKTFSYRDCKELLDREGMGVSLGAVKRWLGRPHVVEWLKERMVGKARMEGYTRERWMEKGLELQDGKHRNGVELVAWKEMGRACGFYEEGPGVVFNQQINFTERQG